MKQEDDGDQEDDDDSDDDVKKRPSGKDVKKKPSMDTANAEPSKKVKHAKVKSEPMKVKSEPMKAKKAKPEDEEIPKNKIMHAMPRLPSDGSNPKPVHYWGGVIYTARRTKQFRALRKRGDSYSESSAAWGGEKPSKDAWQKCVKAIESERKKQKRA